MAKRALDDVDCTITFWATASGEIRLMCRLHGSEALATAADRWFPTLTELTLAHDMHLTNDRTARPRRAAG